MVGDKLVSSFPMTPSPFCGAPISALYLRPASSLFLPTDNWLFTLEYPRIYTTNPVSRSSEYGRKKKKDRVLAGLTFGPYCPRFSNQTNTLSPWLVSTWLIDSSGMGFLINSGKFHASCQRQCAFMKKKYVNIWGERGRKKKQQVEGYPHLDLHSIGAIAQRGQGLSLKNTTKRRWQRKFDHFFF